MSSLEEKIAKLERIIDGYEAEYETASPAEKSELRGLIKTKQETLNRLLDEKNGRSTMTNG